MQKLVLLLSLLFTATLQSTNVSAITDFQADILYLNSLNFIAETEREAFIIAELIEPSGGSPGNICGPLSIMLLKDANLLPSYISTHSFWFLQPRDDYTVQTILEEAFPKEKYLWYRTDISIGEFDFVSFPLYSGDFIYLYAGGLGTYEHILVVTRVDEDGRAYSVTNILTDDGYKISEFLLYDPTKSGEGIFYRLTDRAYNMTIGTTGFGGFQLWRPLEKIESTIAKIFGNDVISIPFRSEEN